MYTVSYNSLDVRYRYRGVQRDPWMLIGGSTCVHGVLVYMCVYVCAGWGNCLKNLMASAKQRKDG